jgi:hypothetical protein
MQLSSLFIAGNHGFTDWWDRYGKTNPEYFGLPPNGRHVPYNRMFPMFNYVIMGKKMNEILPCSNTQIGEN